MHNIANKAVSKYLGKLFTNISEFHFYNTRPSKEKSYTLNILG